MANNKPAAVELHELIYGSAQKLLAPGASDLGVIASTRDFPADAVKRLASHRAYSLQSGQATAGIDVLPVKYILGVLGRHLEFTRVQMGIDHTGRLIPFAHHAIVEQSLVQQRGLAPGTALLGLAQAVRDPTRVPAQWLDPRGVLKPPAVGQEPRLGADILASAADAIIRYPAEKKPVVIVSGAASSGQDLYASSLPVIAAIADLLPRDSLAAFVAVTCVATKEDRLDEASVLCTHAGSQFHQEILSRTGARKTLVIDLATGKADNQSPANTFTRATMQAIAAGTPSSFAVACDKLNARTPHYTAVAGIAEASGRLATQPTFANLEMFCTRIAAVNGLPDRIAAQKFAEERFLETWKSNAGTLTSEIGSLPDGPVRLASMAAFSDGMATCLVRVGLYLSSQHRDSQAAVIALAVRQIGTAGQAIAERLSQSASDKVAAQSFLRLVVGGPETPTDGRSSPSDATVMPKPRPSLRSRSKGGVSSGLHQAESYRGYGVGTGGKQKMRLRSFFGGIVSFVLLFFTLIPFVLVVWPVISDKCHELVGDADPLWPPTWTKVLEIGNGLVESCSAAWSSLIVPGGLFAVALACYLLQRMITQFTYCPLSLLLGRAIAEQVPKLAVALICIVSWCSYFLSPDRSGSRAGDNATPNAAGNAQAGDGM